MGAVSYIHIPKEVRDFIPLDLSGFSGGWIDNWGSDYSLKLEGNKVMLQFDSCGYYLFPDSLSGYKNDDTIRSIRERRFNGAIYNWHSKDNVYSVDYIFFDNELVAIMQDSIVFWTAYPLTIEELNELIKNAVNGDFSMLGKMPTEFAGEILQSEFPLIQISKPKCMNTNTPKSVLSFTVEQTAAEAKLMEMWLNNLRQMGVNFL